MNDLAYVVALKANRALRELTDIYEMIDVHDADDAFAKIKTGVAKAMGSIDDLVREPTLAMDDEARAEFERRFEKFGTLL